MNVRTIWIKQSDEGYVAEVEYDNDENIRFNNDNLAIQEVLDRVKSEIGTKEISAEHFGEKEDENTSDQ